MVERWTIIEGAINLPEDGVVVDTISPNGLQQTLKRSGNLWFVPDGSMYVYYSPMMWKYV